MTSTDNGKKLEYSSSSNASEDDSSDACSSVIRTNVRSAISPKVAMMRRQSFKITGLPVHSSNDDGDSDGPSFKNPKFSTDGTLETVMGKSVESGKQSPKEEKSKSQTVWF